MLKYRKIMSDRRSGDDRRNSNRYPVDVNIEWQGQGERQKGTLSDVSLDGCFVLCSGEVEVGEAIHMYVPLADGMKVEFRGRVRNNVFEIGFGLRFDSVSSAQRDLLIKLVRDAES